MSHGSPANSTGVLGQLHDQPKVIAETEKNLNAMKAGKIEVHPVSEFPGEFHGKSGKFGIFFVADTGK